MGLLGLETLVRLLRLGEIKVHLQVNRLPRVGHFGVGGGVRDGKSISRHLRSNVAQFPLELIVSTHLGHKFPLEVGHIRIELKIQLFCIKKTHWITAAIFFFKIILFLFSCFTIPWRKWKKSGFLALIHVFFHLIAPWPTLTVFKL